MKQPGKNMTVTEEQKQRMAANLDKSFELLNTVMELKLAYLRKMFPQKTESELVHQILIDAIKAKERQWLSRKI